MDRFRTVVEVKPSSKKLDYQSPSLWVGSCFASQIGERAEALKFPVSVNPSGIIYHPLAVARCIDDVLTNKRYKKEELYFFEGRWVSFHHHGSFSANTPEMVLEKINDNIIRAHQVLKTARFLFITFGTAWTYFHYETAQTVANCHKIPAAQFERKKLTVQQVVEVYTKLLEALKDFNNSLQVVFTVSPIRHWKDGAVENQVSKSTLLLAVHELVNTWENCFYFPAYEILMDDLRDYRFYESDMLHPNGTAVDYIWERFVQTYVDQGHQKTMAKLQSLNKALQHRPIYPEANNYGKFLVQQLQLIEDLSVEFPMLNFDKEKSIFQEQLKKTQ